MGPVPVTPLPRPPDPLPRSALSPFRRPSRGRCPVTRRQGEAWPVKVVSLDELIEGDAQVTETATGRRAVLRDAIVTMDSDRSITVSVPAGHTVTVHTGAESVLAPGEYRTLGISALPQ